MYPLTCVGGYPNPMREGSFELVQVRATLSNPAASARITFIDDPNIKRGDKVGKVYTNDFIQQGATRILDTKLDANTGGDVDVVFGETLKVRYGISIVNADNIVAGSLCAYVR
jgi:hypothetical protein